MALTYTLSVSEEKLQKKIAAMMPIEKQKSFYTITLSDPMAEIIEERNEIGVYVNVAIETWRGIKGTGNAKITGALSYNHETCEFFLKNIGLEKLEIDKISDKFSSVIKYIVQWLAAKTFESRAIYRLKDDNLKHKLAKATLQSISIAEGKLLLELSVF